jgi:uncharacterized membrane protein YphA (DoxX/SURF4 family)
MDLNLILWILQVVLAAVFIGAGFTHATQRDHPRPRMEWMQAVPPGALTTIAVLEILGGIGLVVPAATRILPILTPIAAAALALLMLFAAIFHIRRPNELPNVLFNAVLGLLALFVAYGRFVLEPIS